MAIGQLAEGSFCWVELATSDQRSAKAFYSAVLGWQAQDSPMGPDATYTTFKTSGADAGGAFAITAEMKAMNVLVHWALYVRVANADATLARVKSLGGSALREPFDVMQAGRMAVVADPGGAVLMLWQAKEHKGFTPGRQSAFCWADLGTRDENASSKFYSALFGWRFVTDPKFPPAYLLIQHQGQYIGGMPPSSTLPADIPPHWMVWFAVADVDATVNRASAAGGQVLMGPVSMGEGEGAVRMASLADPQGAIFSIIKPPGD